MSHKITLISSVLFFIAVAIIVPLFLSRPTDQAFGSVSIANEYQSTTTSPSINTPAKVSVIKAAPGAFGSIIITEAGSGSGDFTFYDATTTNVNLRTGNKATSSIIIGSVPSDIAVGTYTFDRALHYGLVMVSTAGTVPTSTITYR